MAATFSSLLMKSTFPFLPDFWISVMACLTNCVKNAVTCGSKALRPRRRNSLGKQNLTPRLREIKRDTSIALQAILLTVPRLGSSLLNPKA